MKKFVSINKKAFMLAIIPVLLFACSKKNALVDAVYPEQGIYMSEAAVATQGPNNTYTGVYSITPNIYNQAQRFSVDAAGGKLNIPLGIIRSGVTANDAYTISVAANTDTVGKLITAGKFAVLNDPTTTTELLPASAITFPSSVDLANGSTNATFTVSINLNFLLNSLTTTPKKRYALAVGISNSAKSSLVKTALATTVIFIDPTQVILPVANFSSYVYKETRTGNFDNLSANGVSYSWDFGDGSALSTTPSTSHVYASAGTYAVTLTTTGISGSGAPSVKTTNVTIP